MLAVIFLAFKDLYLAEFKKNKEVTLIIISSFIKFIEIIVVEISH